MIITVQFKDKNKVFKGRIYDYELVDAEIPKKNSIIRMMDENYDWLCHATRVKVVDVKSGSSPFPLQKIRFIEASMEE